MKEYLALIPAAGFTNIVVQKKKPIVVPDEILELHLSKEDLAAFKASNTGIYSISVYAEKP